MKITFGNYTFTDANHDILSADSYRDQALIADTLQADDFNFTVKVDATALGFDIDDFEGFAYATPVSVYDDNDVIQSVFFVVDINTNTYLQTGEIVFDFQCLSLVGTMIDLEHNGGIYTNATNEAVIAEILGATFVSEDAQHNKTYQLSNGVQYVIDKNVASKRVDGWLPIGSVRDNLCKVLNASCVSVLKNADGSIRFTFNQPDTPIVLDPNYEYLGDKYSKTERYTHIAVVQHSFYALSTTAEELIYDSEGAMLSSSKVVFDKPYHSLRGDGVILGTNNCNYAILTGSGQLYGKPYIHGQTQISDVTGLTGTEKYYTSDSNTLITALNSASALERLVNYYGYAKELSCAFVIKDGIKTGSLVSVTDPMNRTKSGFVKRMEITHSGIDKADGIIVTDWVPVAIDEEFTNCDVLTGSGTYTPPAGKRRMLVVCIGGGQAGYNGSNGNNGSGTSGGAGGNGGDGGAGGSIFQELIQNPSGTYNYSAGTGGSSNGALGTASTFANITSASGTPSGSGYMNLITGDIIATKGSNGVAGGKGGNGGTYFVSTSSHAPSSSRGTYGEDVGSYTGGKYGYASVLTYYYSTIVVNTYWSYPYSFSNPKYGAGGGGGGGGAAYGANGSTGGNSRSDYVENKGGNNVGLKLTSGSGGRGANASAPATTSIYGAGGNGGHGGGGGGGYGTTSSVTYPYPTTDPGSSSTPSVTTKTQSGTQGSRGSGGSGSAGTAGGAGVILVYY